MKNNVKLKKYMRFLRLYLNGIFNKLDKELNPEINIVQFKKVKKGYSYELLPDYHEMNISFFIKSNVSIEDFNTDEYYLNYTREIFSQYDEEKGLKAFYSLGAVFTDRIFVVRITIDRKIYTQHNVLFKKKYSSFVDANIYQIIDDINKQNDVVIKDQDFMKLDYKETIRKAAKKFINSSLNMRALSNIFNQINNISSLYYESHVSTGQIVFSTENSIKENHPNIDKILILDQKVILKNKRLIRKLLEICNRDIALLSDGKYVYGICRLVGDFDVEREDIFIVRYLDMYSWEFLYNNKKLLKVDYESVTLPQSKVTYSEFKNRVLELFPDIEASNIVKLYSVMLEALKQEHGTMLVITPNAKSETLRLKSQGFRVKPKEISPSIVREVTSIDGAVLIDTQCYCYGIGVILDGMATSNGDTSRGARYNSAIRYVETIKNNDEYSDCLAIVISEDGYVDIISKFTLHKLGGI